MTKALLAASLALALAAPLRAASAGVDVGPGPEAGAVHVEGELRVSAPPSVAWQVLTDYDHLPEFVSSMKSSRSWRGPQGLRVEQEALGRFGLFHSTLRVVLAITEEARRSISFEDTAACHCFKLYRGSWTILPEAGGALVRYRLDAEPSSAAARLVAKRAMRRNVAKLLVEVGREMERRARSAHG